LQKYNFLQEFKFFNKRSSQKENFEAKNKLKEMLKRGITMDIYLFLGILLQCRISNSNVSK